MDTLDVIDATLDGRCACNCGTALPANGTSAYFVDETHQKRWTQQHADDDDPWADVAAAWETAPADPRTVTVADWLAMNGIDPALAAHTMRISAEEVTVETSGGHWTYPLTVPAEEIYFRAARAVGVKLAG